MQETKQAPTDESTKHLLLFGLYSLASAFQHSVLVDKPEIAYCCSDSYLLGCLLGCPDSELGASGSPVLSSNCS